MTSYDMVRKLTHVNNTAHEIAVNIKGGVVIDYIEGGNYWSLAIEYGDGKSFNTDFSSLLELETFIETMLIGIKCYCGNEI